MTDQTFSDRVKALREKRKLTQAELANQLGVVVSTVSRWERGIGRPRGLAKKELDRLERK